MLPDSSPSGRLSLRPLRLFQESAGQYCAEALGDMALKRAQVQFGYAQRETLPSQCRKFTFLKNCGGECPKIPVCCVEWAVSQV